MSSLSTTEALGEKVKKLREQQGWTQSDLARKLELTRASVNAWEMGISVPSTRYIVELAQLFHVSTDILLGLSSNRTVDASGLTDEDLLLLTGIAQHLRRMRKEQ